MTPSPPKLAVVGLAKNCAATLPGLMDSLAPLQHWFTMQGWFVSPPGSDELRLLAGYGYSSPEPPPRTSQNRYMRMAQLRNHVLELVRESRWNPEYLLWIDLDLARLDCFDGVPRLRRGHDWDLVGFLGLKQWASLKGRHCGPIIEYRGGEYCYYDTLAFESVNRERSLWPDSLRHHGNVPRGTKLVEVPPQISEREWTPVNSAFGGAAFYRWEAIKNLSYREGTGQCEHHDFNAQLSRKFVAPDLVALYDQPDLEPRVIHIWSEYERRDAGAIHRHQVARATWEQEWSKGGWQPFPVTNDQLKRNSETELNDQYPRPYVKDLLDRGRKQANAHDLLLLTNDDTCLRAGFTEYLKEEVAQASCLFAHRWDFPKLAESAPQKTSMEIRQGHRYLGADLFVWRPEAWDGVRDDFPELLLGYEPWDLVMRSIMEERKGRELHHAIYHEWHESYWEDPRRRFQGINKWCRDVGREWLIKHNLPVYGTGL